MVAPRFHFLWGTVPFARPIPHLKILLFFFLLIIPIRPNMATTSSSRSLQLVHKLGHRYSYTLGHPKSLRVSSVSRSDVNIFTPTIDTFFVHYYFWSLRQPTGPKTSDEIGQTSPLSFARWINRLMPNML